MMYSAIKWLHVLSAIVLFGTGIGIAFFKWITDRSGDIRAMRIANEHTVLADWIFTTPAAIVQPLTGFAMVYLAGYSMVAPWLLASYCLYGFIGCCWLPVLVLQWRMRTLARIADDAGLGLPQRYWQYARCWFWLGLPAFFAMLAVLWLMVAKPQF